MFILIVIAIQKILQVWVHIMGDHWLHPRQLLKTRQRGHDFSTLSFATTQLFSSWTLSLRRSFSRSIHIATPSVFSLLYKQLMLSPLRLHVARLGLATRCCKSWLPAAATESSRTELSVGSTGLVPPTLLSPVPSVPPHFCSLSLVLSLKLEVWLTSCLQSCCRVRKDRACSKIKKNDV